MATLFSAIVAITNLCGTVGVDTLGARVVSFVPHGGDEVFFVSGTGTGGMPLCWPWFAGLGPEAGSRRHGVARYCDFRLVSETHRSPRDGELVFRLESGDATRRFFPHDFELEVSVRLADCLTVSMTGRNTGKTPFSVTEALHPYFAVADSGKCVVEGEGTPQCRLTDPVSGRVLEFTQKGGEAYYVWRPNPKSHLSKNVSAIMPGDWRRFICVENGTFKKDMAYTLKPGESHSLVRTVRAARMRASSSAASGRSPSALDAACSGAVLPDKEEFSSWSAAYRELFDLDAAADDAWRAVRDVSAFDARRMELRKKMVARIGGFPSGRTPLNAQMVGCVQADGYRMEKILFESRPGAYVTGNLYVPDSARFAPPYPAAIELCGHSNVGKASAKYQRVAAMAARCGIAVFVLDPLCQGERWQCAEDLKSNCTVSHLRLGVNAMLLGHGLAAFEIWDAMRALDYLDARVDFRHDGYGSFGNSGGGTQCVMLSALDDRIKATATSCFLSNLREQTAWRLLADSEQLIFAQLKDGLNHASYPFLCSGPVLMLARRDEIIPFTGTRETFRLLSAVSSGLKFEGRYSMYDVPGPHGYCERTMRRTVSFLSVQLRGRDADSSAFDGIAELDAKECLVTSTGSVMDLPGFKSAYSRLQEELERAEANRRRLSVADRSALVRRLADVDEKRTGGRVVVSCGNAGGTDIVKSFFETDGGYRIPAVELVPEKVTGAPVLLVGDGKRHERLPKAKEFLAQGRPVMLADIVATGEIGKSRHFYNNPNEDEETAKMLYLAGSSLVGRRAGEIIAIAADLGGRYSHRASVVAFGRTAVAAAHAAAAAPGTVSSVETVNPPLSWSESVRTRAFFDYAASVDGALLHYDWTDLLE